MIKLLQNDWENVLSSEFSKDYFRKLCTFLHQEYEHEMIYPKYEDIFASLNLTPFDKTKVVILGQDPYHGSGQAHGLSFSVQKGVKLPPSLRNIFTELHSDIGCTIPTHGELTSWANQGVLLLNTTLTVREGKPASHCKKGWETFTDEIIRSLNSKDIPVVYILWGAHAQTKKKLIDTDKHFMIESAHPSPLSSYRGFFGSKPFSKCNELLEATNQQSIDWQIL